MAFKTFDRKLYAALESAEGTSIAPSDLTSAYIETTEPTFTITNRMFERNPTRMSITQVPQTVPGTANTAGAPSATIEFTFGVELVGTGDITTAPRWGRLLQSCGFTGGTVHSATTDAITNDGTDQPNCLLHRERFSSGTGVNFNDAEDKGRVISDTFENETLYFSKGAGGGTGNIADDEKICGEVTDGTPYLTASSASAADASGYAFSPSSGAVLGGGNTSSLTIRLVTGSSGEYVEGVGCRGSVEFAMVAGDRVLMNFTFSGRLNAYLTAADGDMDNPVADTLGIPPAFNGVSLGIQMSNFATTSPAPTVTSTIFNSMNINIANEVTVRESVSAASGYDVAYITGRSPSMTFNPDAVTEATYGFWDRFLSGEITRAALTIGSTAGNQFYIKMPALQFTGISDGNRDEVMVYDSTTTLTGGDYGSSILEPPASATTLSTQVNPRLGTNNEFVLFAL